MDEPSWHERALVAGALSPEAASDVETVARGGAVQIAGQVIHRSISFFFNAIAFRVLGAASFGLYRVLAQAVAIAAEIGLLGLNTAALRFITIARARRDHGAVRGTTRTALFGAGVASVVVVLVLVVGAGTIAGWFADDPDQEARLEDLFRLGAIYVPFFALMQVLRYVTQAYKTMVPSVAVGNIIQPALQFAVGTTLLAAGFAVTGAVIGWVSSTAVAAVVGAIYVRRMLTTEEESAPAHSDTAALFRFALPQAGSQLLALQGLGLGVLLLGARSSTVEVGLFAAALALQGPAGVFEAGALRIWAPMVSDLHHRGEIARLGSLYATITRWIATFALPISAAMMIEAELFARLFGGEQAVDAAPVIAILAFGNIFHTCTGPSIHLLTMTGRPGINFLNSLAAVCLYALLGWLVAPEHGAVGVALVDAGVTVLVMSTRVLQAWKLVGVHPFGRSLLKPLSATAAGALTLIAWSVTAPERLWLDIGGLVVATLVYLALLRRFGVDEEERHVWTLLRNRAWRGKP
jgi:O-antigen/teichoic acid export membrane protein